MPVSGLLYIGNDTKNSDSVFHAMNPSTGEALQPDFYEAGEDDVEQACRLAQQAFDSYRQLPPQQRADFLKAIGAQILALGDELLERAHAESGLPLARLTGERGRTIGQLQMFADLLRTPTWMDIRKVEADPSRQPLPRPDLRLRKIALGPVAIFGASNFPLAFSVAGGDTAAALAAGCPVVVKGHPAHPGTGELVGQAILAAAKDCGLPAGVFSLLNGRANKLGATLTAHECIQAVGFTGSRAGGLALMKIANARPVPIPVYAEMSSINPVLLLPNALAEKQQALAEGFIASLTLGAGQFCTNPGLLLAIDSPALEGFLASARTAMADCAAQVMLTENIHQHYTQGVTTLQQSSAQLVAEGLNGDGRNCGRASLFSVAATEVMENPLFTQEVFGSSSLIVRCKDAKEMKAILGGLEGQLTASLHMTAADYPLARELLPLLERRVGRVIANGWPTGVEVSAAMVHGGPFPATSDGRSTSVGTLAIDRFLRPVCYQDMPAELLPEELTSA